MHGVIGVPKLRVQTNATLDKTEWNGPIVLFDPPTLDPTNTHNDIVFGIYVGDKHPETRAAIEVIALFEQDPNYAPVTREGDAVLIGINSHLENWSEPFQKLVHELGPALLTQKFEPTRSEVVARPQEHLLGTWTTMDEPGRTFKRLFITQHGDAWTIEGWGVGGGNAPEIAWGPTSLTLLGDNVGAADLPYGFATWDFGFKVTHLTLRLAKDELVTEEFDIFKDNSGRSNYHTVATLKKQLAVVKDEPLNWKRVPNFFAWDYADQPEPGKRVWLRIDPKTFIERYPSGKENRFRILGPVAVQQVEGILVQISDGALQAFIPYLAGEARGAEKPQPAAAGVEHPQLWMRADDKSEWKLMGDIRHVD